MRCRDRVHFNELSLFPMVCQRHVRESSLEWLVQPHCGEPRLNRVSTLTRVQRTRQRSLCYWPLRRDS